MLLEVKGFHSRKMQFEMTQLRRRRRHVMFFFGQIWQRICYFLWLWNRIGSEETLMSFLRRLACSSASQDRWTNNRKTLNVLLMSGLWKSYTLIAIVRHEIRGTRHEETWVRETTCKKHRITQHDISADKAILWQTWHQLNFEIWNNVTLRYRYL